jgi:hypothetical protein
MAEANGHPLPLAVRLGFAGSRSLFDPSAHPDLDEGDFHAALEAKFRARLARLHAELGLGERYFLCGVSQVAIGGDTIFAEACAALKIPLRVFLPEHREAYLAATGSNGTPDFSPAQRAVALKLLNDPNVIQERVVSGAQERATRFAEVNREIARASDVLVCLLRAESAAKAGGTHDLIDRAVRGNCAVLVIRVAVVGDQPDLAETWHNRQRFRPPVPTPVIESTFLRQRPANPADTPIVDYCKALKTAGSQQAKWQRQLFTAVATIIIGTHILATILAVFALLSHHHEATRGFLPALLGAELAALALGFGVHQYLHRSRAPQVWAMSRLVAELARSVLAIGNLYLYLEYLFWLQFPQSLEPVLETIGILHMRSTRHDASDWKSKRDTYVTERLTKPGGQIEYYAGRAASAGRWLRIWRTAFLVFSGAAFIATALKLVAISSCVSMDEHLKDIATEGLGGLAIVLPLLAVGALSLAAAMDLEARGHIYQEMLVFLEKQLGNFAAAASEPDLARLVLETESHLLGETVNWFSRRSFTGVA